MHEALHEDARGVDAVRLDLAGRHQMLDLGDRHARGGGHHRVEVAGGLAVDEVALRVALPGMDDGDVGEQARLHDVVLAVELAHLLAVGDDGADAGLGEEGRDARAAGPDALGQRALRVELELQLAGEVLLGEQLVLAHVGRDHLADLAGLEKAAEADAVHAGIVGDEGQVLRARITDRLDQRLRNAAEAEAPGHDGHAILDQASERGTRIAVNLIH